MLLRSVSKHIKKQNWFAVVVDFLIVVVGILLAFQITEWGDRQTEKRSLDVALERLHDEIQLNITAIDKYSKRHEDIAIAGQALLTSVHDPDLNAIPMHLIGKVFIDAFTTDYSTSALLSVLNQQSFHGLRSNELRPFISALPAEYLDASEDEMLLIERVDTHFIPYISQKLPTGPLWALGHKGTVWEEYFSYIAKLGNEDAVTLAEFKDLASSMQFQNEVINRIGYERLVLIEQKELRILLVKALALIEEETQ